MVPSRVRIRRLALLLAALSAVSLVLIAACGGSSPTPSPGSSPNSELDPSVAPNLFENMPAIVRLITPSVVHIQTEAVQLDMFNRQTPTVGVGTGEIIDDQGHILTNNHVVAGSQRILVTLSDGRAFVAELLGGDAAFDIAVLRIDAEGLVPIPLGQSSTLQVAEQVIAIGHALDLPGGPTVTGGWVSALDRTLDVSPTITMRNLIQTDAAINPGNSGGPLIDENGEMVGINTARLQGGEGIGFAIAIDPITPLIQEIIETGKIARGFLGISPINITQALALNFNLPVSMGVGVGSVVPGSPADQAGLQTRDIIVGVAQQVVDVYADLDRALVDYRTGSTVEIEFFRGDEKRKTTVTLGDRYLTRV